MTPVKQAVLDIAEILVPSQPRTFLAVFRPWMVITDLGVEDILHLTPKALMEILGCIHTKFSGVLDVLDDEQLREAACRLIGEVVVYGDTFENEGTLPWKIKWNGEVWTYIANSKMQTSTNYLTALRDVRSALEGQG